VCERKKRGGGREKKKGNDKMCMCEIKRIDREREKSMDVKID